MKVPKSMIEHTRTPTIAIDRGASFTDFAVVEAGRLAETLSVAKRDWQSITATYEHLSQRYRNHHSVFTGSTADMPSEIKKEVQVVSEIDAIGFGGSALAGYSDCIVVSIGTGTAVVHFSELGVRHVGGTGLGGGTIKGLSSIICNLDDPVKIESRAREGDPSKVNLTLSDLGYEGLSFLGSDMTASNFAAVRSNRNEDRAAGILRLVGETIGIIASLCAREFKCPDRIVTVGKVANSQFIRHTIGLVARLYQTEFTFPENPGYATVYGAVVKFAHDMLAEER